MSKIITTFTDFDNREWRDHLSGGKGDDKTPDDFDRDDVRIGTAVEREHSSNPDISTEIAIDHLTENPEYYDELIASGIADEKEAIELYNKLKNDSDKKKAILNIKDFIGDEDELDDYEEDEEFDENELDEEEDEDELGTDKAEIDEEDDMITDVYPDIKKDIKEKINYRKMENSIKDYKSFVNEASEVVSSEDTNQPGPERKVSKENKYKFQISYDKKVEQKLADYNFTLYTPEGEKMGKKNFIIIDIQNLTYTIIEEINPSIRQIDAPKLKNIFENL